MFIRLSVILPWTRTHLIMDIWARQDERRRWKIGYLQYEHVYAVAMHNETLYYSINYYNAQIYNIKFSIYLYTIYFIFYIYKYKQRIGIHYILHTPQTLFYPSKCPKIRPGSETEKCFLSDRRTLETDQRWKYLYKSIASYSIIYKSIKRVCSYIKHSTRIHIYTQHTWQYAVHVTNKSHKYTENTIEYIWHIHIYIYIYTHSIYLPV